MAQSGSNKKVASRLVAASCAAVMAVYVAGYTRTQAAADRLATQIAAERRATSPRAVSSINGIRVPAPGVPEGVYPPAAPASSRPKTNAAVARAEPAPIPEPAITVPVGPAAEPSPAEPTEASSPVAQAPVQAVAILVAPVVNPAPVPTPSPAIPEAPQWKDGTYTGWGYSRHGNIEAAVVIERGRIASAAISQCRTRYSCSVIDKLIPQVAQRQSPDVDYVSGATQSADAFYGAVVEALSKAK